MRSGDSKASERQKLLKRPPSILVTTPESLYLLCTAAKSRERLANVRTVIVDEIHALARDKRGVHLSLTLERLAQLGELRPQRIGLSATQRPVLDIARLLVGADKVDAQGLPTCAVIDEGHRRELDLAVNLPDRQLDAVASTEQIGEVVDQIAELVSEHTTTLVFVNTRRLSERLAHMLAERLSEGDVAAHHGSLSKERRLAVERRLRAGELKVLVATASLELGIDIGPVELVCQVGSPRSIATFLQRVGRSGHTRFGTPKGRLFPLTRDELVESAALMGAVRAGRLDTIVFPKAPLDILAQQIVAECAAQTWHEDELFQLVRRAEPYRNLSRESFASVIKMVSEGIQTGRGRRAAYVHRDAINGRLRGRRGARLAALTSGGAIPQTADYRVLAEPGDTFVGTINEDFAIESMAGDVFLLGSTSWRIRRVGQGMVRVVDAQGAMPTIPFWLGEAPSRTFELSEEVSALRAGVDERLSSSSPDAAVSWVQASCCLSEAAAQSLVEYLAAARAALGVLPTLERLVIERFFDETGGMQLVVHSPYGGRINRGLGLLLRKRFCRSFDFELQAAANDDAIVLSLGPQHSFPLDELRDFLQPSGIEKALAHAVLLSPMFQARWRWNLNRSLIVLRFKHGKQNPPPIQRMEADDVMASVFPSLAACQDNATGPRVIPDHPIVNQTLADCMSEAMDATGLARLLQHIADAKVELHFRDTTEASLLSHEILNGRPYTFLDDAPLEERRTRAVALRRGVPLLVRELSALDPEAIDRVARETAPAPRDKEELHDLLLSLHWCRPLTGLDEAFSGLVREGRTLLVDVVDAGGQFWCAQERLAALGNLFPALRRRATNGRRDEEASGGTLDSVAAPDAVAADIVRAHLDIRGPTLARELEAATGLREEQVLLALAVLEREGFALRGRFDTRQSESQVCSRRLLGRIHAYTQKRLRREIEPVSPQDFMRFLLQFQRVTSETRRHGQRGVLETVEQLQGYEAAAAVWEPDLLATRVRGYQPEWLDAHCWSGAVMWGRLAPRGKSNAAWASVSKVTPVTLALRDDFGWLVRAVRGNDELEQPSLEPSLSTLSALRDRGALFFNELLEATGFSPGQVTDALWDGVARGLITADGFAALRGLVAPEVRYVSTPRRNRGLRRGARQRDAHGGRWALLQPPQQAGDREELAEAMAEQLLARYGVVFRDLVGRESLGIPWRDISWALRRLEARGTIRGGRFVAGFVGEQYALPEAVDWLRRVRKAPLSGERVELSACDPLNLVGIVVPGPRVPQVRGQRVSFVDGVYVSCGADTLSVLRPVGT
jgi:ATP-dependent Lhr-like helicase